MNAVPNKTSFAMSERPAKTDVAAGERFRPLWIPKAEALTVKQALHLFSEDYALSEDTLRRLIARHGIANRSVAGGPWRVSALGLAMALDGDTDALERLRQDDRRHPDVVRYFLRLGIPAE